MTPKPASESQERLYHEIMCPSLTKTGPCNCAPIIVANSETLDVLAWLASEQRKAERWGYGATGVYRFQLTGPELNRIRHLIEKAPPASAPPAPEPQGWQPIATYGEREDYVLLCSSAHGRVIGAHVTGDVWHFVGVGCVTSESERPTHWMPLPAPPASAPAVPVPREEP